MKVEIVVTLIIVCLIGATLIWILGVLFTSVAGCLVVIAFPFTAPFIVPKYCYFFLVEDFGFNEVISGIISFIVFLIVCIVEGAIIWFVYQVLLFFGVL